MKALITGATRGLGLEIARRLWRSGYELFLVARTRGDLESVASALPGSKFLAIDLLSPNALIPYPFGTELDFDVLVNNAGAQTPIGPFVSDRFQRWRDSFELNFFSPARLCWSLLPGMISRGWGKIINISGGGATFGRENFSAYASAKTALVRFTETIAEEVRPFNVDVNAVAPGPMYSEVTESVIRAGRDRAGGKGYDEAVKIARERPGTDAAALLCCFLASHDSDGITGKLISAIHDPWPCWKKGEKIDAEKYTLRRTV